MRALFHVPEGGPYLLAHSAGCLPRTARAALERDLLMPWATQGGDAWGAWLGAIDRFRRAVAGVIGGSMDEVCPQPSVSAGVSRLISALPRGAGRDVLLASAHSFPSIGFAMGAYERLGFRLELIPEEEDPADPGTWLKRIDARVAMVVPMLVHSNSGRMAPVSAIAAAAHAAGALSVVDICQGVGVVPVDVRGLGVDCAVGSCLKWLCGGPGAGFLWVARERLADLSPIEVGWFSHEEPFAFDIRDFRYAPDALRFWGGTPSIAPFALAAEGVETIAGIGVDAIMAHNRRCITALAMTCGQPQEMEGRGGTLCLASPQADAMADVLRAIGARFDRRGDVLRLSLHVWNDEDEAAALGAALRGHDFALA